jgi:hypothetical protein
MAKWEIRFQRSARSFRLFTLGHCCFRFRLAFSLQPLAFAIEPREAKPFTWTRMAKWEIRFQRFARSFRPSALRLHSISARQVDAVNPIEFDGISRFLQ